MNLGRLAAHIRRGISLKTATSWLAHSHWFSRLHLLIEAHCSALVEQLAPRGKFLPDHVLREFDVFLKCGRLEHGFLRMRCKKSG